MKVLLIAIAALALGGYGAYSKYADGESKIVLAGERRERALKETAELEKTLAARQVTLDSAKAALAALKADLDETAKSAPVKALAEARPVVQKRRDELAAELTAAKASAELSIPEETATAIKTAEDELTAANARIKKADTELPKLLAFRAAEEAAGSKPSDKPRRR